MKHRTDVGGSICDSVRSKIGTDVWINVGIGVWDNVVTSVWDRVRVDVRIGIQDIIREYFQQGER